MTSTQGETNLFDALNKNTSPRLSEAAIQELLENPQRRAILRYLEVQSDGARSTRRLFCCQR